MLRIYFRYDRRLLGRLCRLASRVIPKSFRALSGRADLEPGMVVCVQTFGNFASVHPHLHVLVTDGRHSGDRGRQSIGKGGAAPLLAQMDIEYLPFLGGCIPPGRRGEG